jgi:predicted transcriptional regulator
MNKYTEAENQVHRIFLAELAHIFINNDAGSACKVPKNLHRPTADMQSGTPARVMDFDGVGNQGLRQNSQGLETRHRGFCHHLYVQEGVKVAQK